MDIFCEQILKQSMDIKRLMIVIGSIVGVVLACILSMLFLPWLFFPIAALSGFGLYWIISMQSWEVEYAVTNGEIDIDRIIARRDRKKIVRVRGEKIERLIPVSLIDSNEKFDRVVMAARSRNTATWAFSYQGKMGSTLVLFEPNDDIFDALCKGMLRSVKIETDRIQREM